MEAKGGGEEIREVKEGSRGRTDHITEVREIREGKQYRV